MRTVDEIAAELYALYERREDAQSVALTMIRLLDYDADLVINPAAYRVEVRKILDGLERARIRRLADLRAACEAGVTGYPLGGHAGRAPGRRDRR